MLPLPNWARQVNVVVGAITSDEQTYQLAWGGSAIRQQPSCCFVVWVSEYPSNDSGVIYAGNYHGETGKFATNSILLEGRLLAVSRRS